MKKLIPFILLLFTGILILGSCTNSKQAAVNRKMALLESKLPSYQCFVELTDGTIRNFTTLVLVTSIYKSPHLLADGKIKIYSTDIISYQNKDHFAIAAAGFSYGGHKSKIASETLPGFAVRIAAGRLNVYIKKYKNDHTVIDEFFLQEGNGQVLAYTPELMDALIKNNPEALDFYNNNRRLVKLTKQLKLTARIFNNAYFELNPESFDPNAVAFSGKRKPKK